MKHILSLLLAVFCAGLWADNATAQWIKPRNALVLPLETPVDIELVIPDESLGYQAYVPRSTGSPLGDALGAETIRRQEEKFLQPSLVRLNQGMTHDHRADALTAAIRRELEATGKIKLGELRVHRKVPITALPRGDAASNVMVIIAGYEMQTGFAMLDVSLDVRYGPGSEALAVNRVPKLVFAQHISHLEPRVVRSKKSGGLFGWMEVAAQDWEAIGPATISSQIDAGLQEVAAMLAYEIQRKPHFGRISGKQYALGDNFGVVEHKAGERSWLRVRNGRLSSLPNSEME
jgi:hypothetical protein